MSGIDWFKKKIKPTQLRPEPTPPPEPEPDPKPADEGPNGEREGDLRVALDWNNVSNHWDVSVQRWGIPPSDHYIRWGPFYRWMYWQDEYAIYQDWGGQALPLSVSAATTREGAEQIGCRMLRNVRAFTPSGPKNVYINEGDCK